MLRGTACSIPSELPIRHGRCEEATSENNEMTQNLHAVIHTFKFPFGRTVNTNSLSGRALHVCNIPFARPQHMLTRLALMEHGVLPPSGMSCAACGSNVVGTFKATIKSNVERQTRRGGSRRRMRQIAGHAKSDITS